MTPFPGKIAVLGGGSWATALAKLLLDNVDSIVWYMRRDDRIADFKALGRNPAYLTDVRFDINRIDFTSDINYACQHADTLLLATPSPYFKDHADKITVDISAKAVVSAIKGIVPGENIPVTDFMARRFGISKDKILVIGGPCHAEEVALGRPACLTIGCRNADNAAAFAALLAGTAMRTVVSNDVDGIEYAAVLKNVYAIAAGVVHGLKKGDNFQALLVSNAIREMRRFLNAVSPADRDICDSAYLGDLLVTAYSRFSRNHNFGAIVGRGYSVKNAIMEMEQTAEGYYGTRTMYEINRSVGVDMPILEGVYHILYSAANAATVMRNIGVTFT